MPVPEEEAARLGVTPFPASPFEPILMGGKATDITAEDGPVRFFTPAEVERNAELLLSVTDEEFSDRFDAAAPDDVKIPPDGWSDDTERLESLLLAFSEMKNFYRQAADHHAGILVSFLR